MSHRKSFAEPQRRCQNSCSNPARAKAAKTKSAYAQGRWAASVVRTSTIATAAAKIAGLRKTLRAEAQLTRRQASSGPIPVKSTRTIASGVV